jgi:hypothetical protein
MFDPSIDLLLAALHIDALVYICRTPPADAPVGVCSRQFVTRVGRASDSEAASADSKPPMV